MNLMKSVMVSGENVFDAWLKTAEKVQINGAKYMQGGVSGRKNELRELINVLVKIETPMVTADEYRIIRAIHPPGLLEWMDVLWQNLDEREIARQMPGLGFSYAQRLYDFKGIDQVRRIIEILKVRPWTRRATISIYNPLEDDYQVPASPPCASVMDFKLREGKLYMSVFFRSWDVGKKFYSDANNFGLIQKRVADEVGATPAGLTILVASAHIYLDDVGLFQKAGEMAKALPG